eukprot:scaffold32648_cov63-Phaeocystis_antarctica.AAC.3
MLESSRERPSFEPLSRAGPNGTLRCGRAAPAEAADPAALDTQARRSPATLCAPTRARASLLG